MRQDGKLISSNLEIPSIKKHITEHVEKDPEQEETPSDDVYTEIAEEALESYTPMKKIRHSVQEQS